MSLKKLRVMTASPYPPTVSREGLSASLLTAVFTSEESSARISDQEFGFQLCLQLGIGSRIGRGRRFGGVHGFLRMQGNTRQ